MQSIWEDKSKKKYQQAKILSGTPLFLRPFAQLSFNLFSFT